MPSPRPAFAKAVALKSLELAIRFWPEDSRYWGQALLAETHEITHPIEALFWALGGVTVFLRSHLTHLLTLLKLPPGRTTAALPLGPNGPRFPHNSRLVTALILLVVAVLLLLPAGREATRIVSSSWQDFQPTPADTRVVERLAAKAEKDRDARQLAFLANCEPDPDLSERFANRAVELDPSLFWIYAGRYRRPADTIDHEWLQRMRSADPDNAFVYIVTAQAAVDPLVWSKFGPDGPSSSAASHAPGYSEWIANMDRAFQSPRYNSYSRRHLDLTRTGWRQAPEVPLSLVAYSMWSHLLPDLGLIQTYADTRIRDAQSAGYSNDAERDLQAISAFGQRMIDGSETDIEHLVALEVARRGQDALRKFYAQSGRPADAQIAATQVRQLEISKENLFRSGSKSRGESWDYFRRRATFVQILAWSAISVAALTFVTIFLLEFCAVPWHTSNRIRWIACRVADFGPAAVLVLATAFLYSFRPFAFAVAQYRANSTINAATPDFIWQLMTLSFVSPIRYLFQPSGQAALWLLLIIALSLIAVAIVVRVIWRLIAHAHHA